MRTAALEHKTNETEIHVELNLDGSGQYEIQTGIGFLDHMLAQIAVHGLFDLVIIAKGDLNVDPHHTVEDCGLALGAAFKQSLGDRSGIVRTASVAVPMDEALAWGVVDFSGRPYTVLRMAWTSPMVGDLPASLLEHFFESFASACGANLHLIVEYGRDNHHMAEALFKAMARAMSKAVQVDPRRIGKIPSSKGVLN
jgi:imidazoleglycerol-phosphate dehydratase